MPGRESSDDDGARGSAHRRTDGGGHAGHDHDSGDGHSRDDGRDTGHGSGRDLGGGHGHDYGGGRGHDHGGGHDHGAGSTSRRKLAAVAVINLVGFVAELAGGLAFGSVALVSDAVHMLFDALAYVMAFAAAYVADTYERSGKYSFGLHRLEPLAAFLNGILLLPMVGYILWESYQRFLDPVAIGAGPTVAIAVGGLLVNVGSVYVLAGDEMSLNERGAFYHLLGDAGGSVVVIVSVAAVELLGIRAVDPAAAVLIAGVVTWSSVTVLRGSGAVFFLKTPVESDAVRGAIQGVDGVTGVADFHAWQVCSRLTVATTHVETDVETMSDAEAVNDRVHAILADHGVDHATVELRSPGGDHSSRTVAHGH